MSYGLSAINFCNGFCSTSTRLQTFENMNSKLKYFFGKTFQKGYMGPLVKFEDMLLPLDDTAKKRRMLGLTQKQLAKIAV
jgi:hypothetical protein